MGAVRTAMVMSSMLMLGLGCESQQKPPMAPPPPPASIYDVMHVQMSFQAHDRGARAGQVLKVRTAEKLAAVRLSSDAGSATDPIRVDDSFTFVDSAKTPLANGKVVSVDRDLLVVSYIPVAGGRAPAEGDMAVHLTMGM